MFCGAAITDPSTQTDNPTIAFAHLILIHENGCCCVSSLHVTCSIHVFAIETIYLSDFLWSAIAHLSPASRKNTSAGTEQKQVMSNGGVTKQTHI